MKSSIFTLGVIAPAAVLAFCRNDDFNLRAPNITNSQARRNLNSLGKRDLISVSMYTHIMMAAPPTEDYGPSLQVQRDLINKNYAQWGFQFVDVGTMYYFNADWAANADALRQEKSSQVRRGDYAALNMYLVEGEQAGFCFFPTDPAGGPVDQATLDNDGCFVGIKDGRSATGGTLTHESMFTSSPQTVGSRFLTHSTVGHWLGLPHVFEGGCAGSDGCDDTVPQAEPGRGVMAIPGDFNSCAATAKESCTPGIKDNVKNFVSQPNFSTHILGLNGVLI